MWKMDIVYFHANEIKRIERIDDKVFSKWLNANNRTIKYDYQHRAWLVVNGITPEEAEKLHSLV